MFSSLSGMKVGAQSSAVNEAEADVVVVGYGAAGAAAAIEAAKAGAKVIILEKAPQKTHCSTTRLSSGIYLSPDAAIDKEVLKDYIVSTYLRDGAELRRQGRLPAPLGDLAEVWATLAPETFAWLQSLDPDFRSATPPLYTRSQFVNLWHGVKPHIQAQVATYSLWRDFYQSTYRAPKSETLNGEALYACLAAGIEAHAVPVHYGERAVALEVQNGIVCGVWAQSDKGRTLYRARLGVILASGGFAFNRALRQALLPREANDYWAVSSSPENTGDGLALGLSQGADIVRSSAYFDRFCILLPERLHGVRLGVPMDCVGRPHTLLVDNLGRRFTSESDLQDIYQHYGYVDEMLRLDSDTHRCERTPTWCIFDEVMMKSAPIATLGEGSTVSRLVDWTTNQQALEKGWILRGDTIEVLAAKIAAHPDNAQRMSAAVLQNTLNTFNDYALRRLDTDFDRAPATMRPLSEGPYYAVPVSIDVPHMAAGLRTDARRAVVRRDGQPIPGLFAAGEVAPVSRLMHDKGGTSRNVWCLGVMWDASLLSNRHSLKRCNMARIGLRRHLQWSLTLMALIPLVALSVSLFLQVKEVQEQSMRHLQQTVMRFADDLERELYEKREMLEEAAVSIRSLQGSEQGKGGNRGFREASMDELVSHLLYTAGGRFSQTVYVSGDGHLKGFAAGLSLASAREIAYRLSQQWVFRHVKRHAQGAISEAFMLDGRAYIMIAVPVLSERGQEGGVIASQVAMSDLLLAMVMPQLPVHTTLQLTEQDGRTLIGLGSLQSTNPLTATVEIRSLDWNLIYSAPPAEILSRAWVIALTGLLMVILVAIGSYMVGLVHLKQLSAFLDTLVANLRLIGRGELERAQHVVSDTDVPEANAIMAEFRLMAKHLRASQAALETINATLEDRITERTQQLATAHRETERQHAALTALFSAMSEGFALVNAKGHPIFVNQQFRQILTLSAQGEAILLALENPQTGISPALGVFYDALQRPELQTLWTVSRPGGKERRLSVEAFHVSLANETGIGFLIRDVTHEYEVGQLKDDVVALVSHELNNPVSTLILGLETLKEKGERLPVLLKQNILQNLLSETVRLKALIHDWLDISMLNNGVMPCVRKPLMIDELLEQVVQTWEAQHGVPVTLALPPESVSLLGDESRLTQVFTNLLDNALRYNDKPEKKIQVRLQVDTEAVRIDFEDNGMGMLPEEIAGLFERFYRTDRAKRHVPTGSGLGLAICRGIMAAHDGQIEVVHTAPNEGTTFRITLPRKA